MGWYKLHTVTESTAINVIQNGTKYHKIFSRVIYMGGMLNTCIATFEISCCMCVKSFSYTVDSTHTAESPKNCNL